MQILVIVLYVSLNPLTPKAKQHFLQIQDYKLIFHVWYTILKLLMNVFHNWYNYEWEKLLLWDKWA